MSQRTCTNVHMDKESRGELHVSFLRMSSSLLFPGHGFFNDQCLQTRLGWLTIRPWRSACLFLLSAGNRNSCHHALFVNIGFGNWTQNLMIIWQTLYWWSYLPDPFITFFCFVPLIAVEPMTRVQSKCTLNAVTIVLIWDLGNSFNSWIFMSSSPVVLIFSFSGECPVLFLVF